MLRLHGRHECCSRRSGCTKLSSSPAQQALNDVPGTGVSPGADNSSVVNSTLSYRCRLVSMTATMVLWCGRQCDCCHMCCFRIVLLTSRTQLSLPTARLALLLLPSHVSASVGDSDSAVAQYCMACHHMCPGCQWRRRRCCDSTESLHRLLPSYVLVSVEHATVLWFDLHCLCCHKHQCRWWWRQCCDGTAVKSSAARGAVAHSCPCRRHNRHCIGYRHVSRCQWSRRRRCDSTAHKSATVGGAVETQLSSTMAR